MSGRRKIYMNKKGLTRRGYNTKNELKVLCVLFFVFLRLFHIENKLASPSESRRDTEMKKIFFISNCKYISASHFRRRNSNAIFSCELLFCGLSLSNLSKIDAKYVLAI